MNSMRVLLTPESVAAQRARLAASRQEKAAIMEALNDIPTPPCRTHNWEVVDATGENVIATYDTRDKAAMRAADESAGAQVRKGAIVSCPAFKDCAAKKMACLDFARYAGMSKGLGDAMTTNLRQPSPEWYAFVYFDKDTDDESDPAQAANAAERRGLYRAATKSTPRVWA